MSAPLKQYHDYEEDVHVEDSPKFHEFPVKQSQPSGAKLQEVFFFAKVATFSLVAVLFAFVLLALNLAPLWSFLIAGLISLGITSFLSHTVAAFLKH
ncbi:MAG: DUF3270 domain-containing protein [Streptococcus pyogenes]|nr:MAG: DUF3270 domain-containing protein [Streptococcus pyogenes]